MSNLQKYAPGYLHGNEAGSERLADDAVSPLTERPSAEHIRQPLVEYPTSLNQTNARTGLWLHPDDLSPENGPLMSLAPLSIAAHISDQRYITSYNLSERRIASLHSVIQDSLQRAAAHFGCPVETLHTEDPVEGLLAWTRKHMLAEVVALAPTVGPIHDLLPRLKDQLEANGIRLTLIRRPSDSATYSLATAGFFPFWQKTSRRLKALQQA